LHCEVSSYLLLYLAYERWGGDKLIKQASKKQKEQRAYDNFCFALLKTTSGFIMIRTIDSQISEMLSFGRPITYLAAVCAH
jgi:hypothetical protein